MDEALRSPAPDRFWESAWTFSGPDKDRGDLKFKFYQLDSHYLQISTNPLFLRQLMNASTEVPSAINI